MQPEVSSQVDAIIRLYLLPAAWRILGAVAIWLVGSWAIKLLRKALKRFMRLRALDVTLATYLDTGATVVLQLLVLIAIMSVLGVETTSFAALLAAAGIAIGAAWSGLLSNFAAGLFLLTFRPFKVGDMIAAAGVTGKVREISLFVTTIDTQDHVLTFVGNNRLFSENVQNYSANAYRRVDLTAQLPAAVDPETAGQRLLEIVSTIPRVLSSPAPKVDILAFTSTGAVLAVRPFCSSGDYWQVYFDTNRAISRFLVGNVERAQQAGAGAFQEAL